IDPGGGDPDADLPRARLGGGYFAHDEDACWRALPFVPSCFHDAPDAIPVGSRPEILMSLTDLPSPNSRSFAIAQGGLVAAMAAPPTAPLALAPGDLPHISQLVSALPRPGPCRHRRTTRHQ